MLIGGATGHKMETTQVTINKIQLIGEDVNIITNEEFDGYKVVNNEKVAAKVNQFSINIVAFTGQIRAINEDIDLYRDVRGSRFDNAALVLIFKGATLAIERTPYKAGEDIVNWDGVIPTGEDGKPLVHQNDGYTTTIRKIKLTERGNARLQAKLVL